MHSEVGCGAEPHLIAMEHALSEVVKTKDCPGRLNRKEKGKIYALMTGLCLLLAKNCDFSADNKTGEASYNINQRG